jgi:hypothetical protein
MDMMICEDEVAYLVALYSGSGRVVNLLYKAISYKFTYCIFFVYSSKNLIEAAKYGSSEVYLNETGRTLYFQ